MKQDFDFMDEAARKALENWEVPFDSQDWAKLEKQLNQGKHLIDERKLPDVYREKCAKVRVGKPDGLRERSP